MKRGNKKEKINNMVEKIIENRKGEKYKKMKFSLNDIVFALASPYRVGWDDLMEKEVFTWEDYKNILHTVWPRLMSEEKWREMVEILQEKEKNEETER